MLGNVIVNIILSYITQIKSYYSLEIKQETMPTHKITHNKSYFDPVRKLEAIEREFVPIDFLCQISEWPNGDKR